MSNETQVKQEDRELIEAIAEPWICVEDPPCEETESVHWEELLTSLTAALATIRKDARREAFAGLPEIIDKAVKESPVFTFHSKQGREFLMAALERAAEEEGNNGTRG